MDSELIEQPLTIDQVMEGVEQAAYETVGNLLDVDAIKDSYDEILKDYPEKVSEIKEMVKEQVMQMPELQQAISDYKTDIEEALNENGDVTVGDITATAAETLFPKLGQILKDSAETILQLGVDVAKQALGYEFVQNVLKDKVGDIIFNFVERWVWGDAEIDSTEYSMLNLISVIAAPILGYDTWLGIVGSVANALAVLSPAIESGLDVIGAILTIGNLTGYLTSNGGPFTLTSFQQAGTTYIGTAINGLGIYFDINPTVKRLPMIIVNTKAALPGSISAAMKAVLDYIPGLGSLARFIVSRINSGLSVKEAANVNADLISRFGLSDIASKTLNDFVNALANYFAGLKNKLPQIPTPDGGIQVSPGKPSGVDAMYPVVNTDEVSSAAQAQEEFRPGSRYPYLMVGSDLSDVVE